MWLLLCLCALAYAQDGPRVTTTQGVVVGQRIEDGDYLAFYGVHYGGDTAGENRFKAPTPPPMYQEEFLATDNTIRCAQPSSQQLIGTEDCLRLNIHTKNLTTPKPVMVWIEGEDYDKTGSVDSFKNLVEEDLLVVSINYRLSIFGFLCLGVTDAPGNAGLKDIVQGLKWIKENIAGFGGDPNNVILLGHGSGAALVDLITLSPMSQNLVHKAIVLSGSGLAPWAVSYDPIGYATQVVEKLGFPDRSVEDMAKILAATDNLLLNSVLTDFQLYDASLLFAPCVENANLNSSDPFLSDAPINILRSGNYVHIPYVAGFVNKEGTLRLRQAINNNWLSRMEYFFGDFIQVDLAFESEDKRRAVTRNIRQNYFAESTVNMGTIEDYIEYLGDTLILFPVIRATKERALTSRANVWLFKFTYMGTRNSDWPFPQIPVTGAPHGVLVNYLLNYDLKGIDQSANKAITHRFTGFAYTGIPERLPNSTTSNNDVKWESISDTRVPTLLISGGQIAPNVSIVSQEIAFGINSETTEFWDPIIAAHYRAPRPVSSANTLFSFGLVVLATQTFLRLLF